MTHEQRTDILHQIARALEQRRLLAPARIALDIVAPIGFLASQAATFIQPFFPEGRWRSYVAALSDQEGWDLLQRMVETRDC